MTRILVVLLVLAFALPAAAADGEPLNGRIIFGDVTSLDSVMPDGTGHKVLTRSWSYQGVSPSPDGRSLATAGPDALVFLSSATGAETSRLSMPGQTWLGGAAWSPDGRELAFQNCEKTRFTDIEECVRYGVYVVQVDGTHLRRIAEGTSPSWSSDGRSLAFVHAVRAHDKNGNECDGVYTARVAGGPVHRVFPRRVSCSGDLTSAQPFFAAGDQRVMYVRGDTLWSVRLNGSHERRVVRVQRHRVISLARLSPDGRRIVYSGGAFDKYPGSLWVTSARGGRGRRIAHVKISVNTLGWLPVASG